MDYCMDWTTGMTFRDRFNHKNALSFVLPCLDELACIYNVKNQAHLESCMCLRKRYRYINERVMALWQFAEPTASVQKESIDM